MTVVEVLVSLVIVTIGLIGLATVLPLSSRGVQTGNQLSTATLLAEQRLEQVRAAQWTAIPSVDCVGTSGATVTSWSFSSGRAPVPTGACFPAEFTDETPAGSEALDSPTRLPDPFSQYVRQVRIRPCDAPASDCGVVDPSLRLVTVRVASSIPGSARHAAPAASVVELTTLVARR